jgi:hypothetical protein
MTAKITAFLGITVLMLAISVLSTSTVFAAGATAYSADVTAGGVDVGDATLIVSNRTLTVMVHTTGLNPGHVFSVWGIFEGSDFKFDPNLTGKISDSDGSLSFGGALSVDPKFDVETFTIKLKDHGLPIPGQVQDQRSTKTVGCVGGCDTVQKAVFNLN